MNLTSLDFGAFLSYSPRGNTPEIQKSKNAMYYLKNDSYVQHPPILMSQWVAQMIEQRRSTLPFNSFFRPNTILIPTPRSSLMKPDSLWVPDRLATALVNRGLAKEVVRCLSRTKAVPKAAFCAAQDRPTPDQHYKSMAVNGNFSKLDEIVLVDDVITRGSTLLGAANRLADAFPTTRVRAFAAMRTISDPNDFQKLIDPCIGTITPRSSGDTLRRP